MNSNGTRKNTSARIELDPPTFSPPPEMRSSYVKMRCSELEAMEDTARNGVWKPVDLIANHVRGTAAMYGFAGIGEAAENLAKAIQNGDPKCLDYLQVYVDTVRKA